MLAGFPLSAHAGCNAAVTSLHALAGAAPRANLHVRGVVTAVFPGLRGFFLEAPRAAWDANPQTSEAVFVYLGRRKHPHLVPGDLAALGAKYLSFHGMPELSRVRSIARCGHGTLPPAVPVSLPLAPGAWMTMLGMRVRVVQTLTVNDLGDFVRYGEVRAGTGGRHYAASALTSPGPRALALERAASRRNLWLDDGSTQAYPAVLRLGRWRFDAVHPLRVGMQLRAISGVAYHAFGRNLVEVTGLGLETGSNPRRSVRDLRLPAGLRIVSFNVQNYFNRALTGPAFPTERGARDATRFQCQTRKLVAALAALRPAVAGLQEIENNGYGARGALATLVRALNQRLGEARYHYIHPRGPRLGTDLIAPALVYDAQRVVPVASVAEVTAPSGDRVLEAGLPRPVLIARFRRLANGAVFAVAVVHLRSKRDACGIGLDSTDGAGFCARARAQAVRYLLHRLAGYATGTLVLLGDFNAYPHEAAITVLLRRGWHSAPGLGAGHSYTENGRWGAGQLDYIWTAPGTAAQVRGAAVWHIDADEAPGFGYAGHPACAGAAAAFRASDHDPVVAVLGIGSS